MNFNNLLSFLHIFNCLRSVVSTFSSVWGVAVATKAFLVYLYRGKVVPLSGDTSSVVSVD